MSVAGFMATCRRQPGEAETKVLLDAIQGYDKGHRTSMDVFEGMRGAFPETFMVDFVKVMIRVGVSKTFIESHGLPLVPEEASFAPFSVPGAMDDVDSDSDYEVDEYGERAASSSRRARRPRTETGQLAKARDVFRRGYRKTNQRRNKSNGWLKEESRYLAELVEQHRQSLRIAGRSPKRPKWSELAHKVNKRFNRDKDGASASQHYNRVLLAPTTIFTMGSHPSTPPGPAR